MSTEQEQVSKEEVVTIVEPVTTDQTTQVVTETAEMATTTTAEVEGKVEESDVKIEQVETGANTTKTPFNPGATLAAYFHAKNQLMRQMWAEQQVRLAAARSRDQTHLVGIIVIVFIAVACSIAAIATQNWICSCCPNSRGHYGIWNTCFYANPTNNTTNNDSIVVIPSADTVSRVSCARQELGQLIVSIADQSRVDQVTAAQGLITAGTVIYALSLLGALQACRLLGQTNAEIGASGQQLNVLRNLLAMAMFIQIVSFLMHLIGLFLYMLTEHISTSIGLLFVYFGIAIFATNFINFITIEYKCYKFRQV